MTHKPQFMSYEPLRFSVEEMRKRAEEFYQLLDARRSVRAFSDQTVPRDLIETAILAAGTAPSGAHRQPWRFVVVGDPAIKGKLRKNIQASMHAFVQHLDGDLFASRSVGGEHGRHAASTEQSG